MGLRRRTADRREPNFDATPTPGMNLRLTPADRPGGVPPDEKPRPARIRREPVRERRAPETKSEPRARRETHDEGPQRERKGARRKRGGTGRRGFKRLLYWLFVLCLWTAIAVAALLTYVALRLPAIQSLEVPKRPPSIQIVDLDGKPLALRGEMRGSDIPLTDVPEHLMKAVIAIEDRRFYDHFGVDPFGVARAVVANVMRRGVAQGGSTLTQQLAKNLFLTQERTYQRKLQEVVLALWLERKFSKRQILELYLNRVYFGAGAYGVEAAAQRYFGKSARQLTLPESAILAGLVKSPSKLAPTHNPKAAQKRAQLVLAAMSDAGFITEAAEKNALAQPAKVSRSAASGTAGYAADWIVESLDELVGRVDGDIVVETTIDATLQANAERILAEEIAAKGAKFDVEQGALIVMSPDGAIRALVGGKNYAESQYNRAVAAKRQPGSAFKPFVYLTALERGLTPDTTREDRPINVKGWQPENYTREYFGAVTLSRALAMSLNTVSVRLTLEVGPKAVVQTAHRLGISSKLEPNASIALGTSEVSMLELVSAFAPFANGGSAVTPYTVTRVRKADGTVLHESGQSMLGRVVDARYVAMMNAMMHETIAIGTARKAELAGWTVAGKTGTSQDFRDAWFVGYSAYLVGGVWLGNDDSSATKKLTGSSMPVEVWSRVMKAAHENVRPLELPGAGNRTNWAAPGGPAPAPSTPRTPGNQPPSLDRWLIDTLFGRR
ncbi:MAG: penicillin-binding protein [Variibacter sp.]|jgi:penicillin-binding protein 1A|nr:penicillin-binding protein [Variibacter sp.]